MSDTDAATSVSWVVVILFLWVFAVLRSFRNEAEAKDYAIEKKAEVALKKAKDAEVEMELIAQAASALPDAIAAVTLLKSRYGWAEIVNTIGLHRLHLETLREVKYSSEIDLPNMKLRRYGREEARVIKRAKEIATPRDYEYGLESIFQEPTTDTLLELHQWGYVKASSRGDKNGRQYTVVATEMGQHLIGLDAKFSDPNDGLPGFCITPSSEQARRAVSHIVYSSIRAK